MSALGVNTDQLRAISRTGGQPTATVNGYSPFVDPQTGRAVAFDQVALGTMPVADQWMLRQLQTWLDTQTHVSAPIKEALGRYLKTGQRPEMGVWDAVCTVLNQALRPAAITQMGLSPDQVDTLTRYRVAVSASGPDLAQVMGDARDGLMTDMGISETEAKFRERSALVSPDDPTVLMILADLNRQGLLKPGMAEGDIAAAITAYVQQNYQYIQDNPTVDGRQMDDWQSVSETLARKGGDCEDLAILTASLMMGALIQSGVPQSEVAQRVTLAAGYIGDDNDNFRGHATVKFVTSSGDSLALDATSGKPPFAFQALNMDVLFESNAFQFTKHGTIDDLFNTALKISGENSVVAAINESMDKLKALLSAPITVPIASADGQSFTYYDPVTKTMKPLKESDFSREDSPFKFFTMQKETIKPNDTVSWDLWVTKLKPEDFYTILTDSRKYLNQMVMLYHVANSYLQYNYNFAIEIGVTYAEDSQKGELIETIRSSDRFRNKVTAGMNNFLQKVSSSVEETVGQVFQFINSTNAAQQARVEAEIQKYGRQNLAEGIFSGIADELTGAFGLARAQANMELTSLMAKTNLYNAQQYAVYMQEFSGNVQLWQDGDQTQIFSQTVIDALNTKGRTIDVAIEKIYAKDGRSGQLKSLEGKLGSLTPDLSASLDLSVRDNNAADLSSAYILGKSGDVGQYAEFSYNFVLRLRDAMFDYQTAIRTAFLIKDTLLSAKRQAADDIAASNENQAASAKNSMSVQAKGAVQGAMGAELARQYSAMSQVEFGTRNLVASANNYINARYNLESSYRDLANKVYTVTEMIAVATGFSLGKTTRAAVTAAITALYTPLGDPRSGPLYGALVDDLLSKVIPEISAAGMQLTKEAIFYAVEQAKHEINTNVMVQEGAYYGDNPDAVIRDGAIADATNEYGSIYSDDAVTFFTSRLNQIRQKALNYYADLGQQDGSVTANSITGTSYSLYGSTKTNKFLADRGDGGVVVKGGLMASYELDLATNFFKLQIYMIIAKAFQDAMESVVANMFGKSKTGVVSNFDSSFDAYFSKESSKVDAYRYEINERANIINSQQAKYKKLKDQEKNLAFAGTRLGLQEARSTTLTLLSIPVPQLGETATTAYIAVDSAFKLANSALDIADTTYRYKLGDFAPIASNFDKKGDSLTAEFEDRISDTNSNQYLLKTEDETLGHTTEEVLAAIHPDYQQDPYFKSKSQEGLDEYVKNTAVYYRLDAMENAALQRIKDPSSLITQAYDGDFGRFAQVNYEVLTQAYQELTRINQARTFVLMIQQAIYQAKQNMLKHMFGGNAVQGYGGMAALASAIDRYSSAVLGAYGGATGIVNDFLNEAVGRVGATNTRDQAEIAMAMELTGKTVIAATDAVALVRSSFLSVTGVTSETNKEIYERLVTGQLVTNVAVAAAKVGLGAWMMTNVNANKPRITSQMLDFSEEIEAEYVAIPTDKKDKKTKEGEAANEAEGEAETAEAAPAVAEEKPANSEFSKGNYGAYQSDNESSGGFKSRVNSGYQTRAETSVNRRDRQLRLFREISLSLSDARQDAATAFTGNETAKNAYRLINTILKQQTNLELASVGFIFSAIRAAVDSANRGLDMTMEGVTSLVSSAVQMATQYLSAQNKKDAETLDKDKNDGIGHKGGVGDKPQNSPTNKKPGSQTGADDAVMDAVADAAQDPDTDGANASPTPESNEGPATTPTTAAPAPATPTTTGSDKSSDAGSSSAASTEKAEKANELRSTVQDRIKRRAAWAEALQLLGPLMTTILVEALLNDFDPSSMLQDQQDSYGIDGDDYFDSAEAGEFQQAGGDGSGAEASDGLSSGFALSTAQLETATLANTVLSNGYSAARENYQDRGQAYSTVSSQWTNWGRGKTKAAIERTAQRVRDYYDGHEEADMSKLSDKELGANIRQAMTDPYSMQRKGFSAIFGDPRARVFARLAGDAAAHLKNDPTLSDDALGKLAKDKIVEKIKAQSILKESGKLYNTHKVTGLQLVEHRQALQSMKAALAEVDQFEAESIPIGVSEDARNAVDNIQKMRNKLEEMITDAQDIDDAGEGTKASLTALLTRSGFSPDQIASLVNSDHMKSNTFYVGFDPTKSGLLDKDSGYSQSFLAMRSDERKAALAKTLGIDPADSAKMKVIDLIAKNADAENFAQGFETNVKQFLSSISLSSAQLSSALTGPPPPPERQQPANESMDTVEDVFGSSGELPPVPDSNINLNLDPPLPPAMDDRELGAVDGVVLREIVGATIEDLQIQSESHEKLKHAQTAHKNAKQNRDGARETRENAEADKKAADATVTELESQLDGVSDDETLEDLSNIDGALAQAKGKLSDASASKKGNDQALKDLEPKRNKIKENLDVRNRERQEIQKELDEIKIPKPIDLPPFPMGAEAPPPDLIEAPDGELIDPLGSRVDYKKPIIDPAQSQRLSQIATLSSAQNYDISNTNKAKGGAKIPKDAKPMTILQSLQVVIGQSDISNFDVSARIAATYSAHQAAGNNAFDKAVGAPNVADPDAKKIITLFKDAKLKADEQLMFEDLKSRQGSLTQDEQAKFIALKHRGGLATIYDDVKKKSKDLTTKERRELDDLEFLVNKKVKLTVDDKARLVELRDRNEFALKMKGKDKDQIFVGALLNEIGVHRNTGIKSDTQTDTTLTWMFGDIVLNNLNMDRDAVSLPAGNVGSSKSKDLNEVLRFDSKKVDSAKAQQLKDFLNSLDPAIRQKVAPNGKIDQDALNQLIKTAAAESALFEKQMAAFPPQFQTDAFKALPYAEKVKKIDEHNAKLEKQVQSLVGPGGLFEGEAPENLPTRIAAHNRTVNAAHDAFAEAHPGFVTNGVIDRNKIAAHNNDVLKRREAIQSSNKALADFRKNNPQFDAVPDDQLGQAVKAHNSGIAAKQSRRDVLKGQLATIDELDEQDNQELVAVDKEKKDLEESGKKIDQTIANVTDRINNLESQLKEKRADNNAKLYRNVARAILRTAIGNQLTAAKARQSDAGEVLNTARDSEAEAENKVTQTESELNQSTDDARNADQVVADKNAAAARAQSLRDTATSAAATFIKQGVANFLSGSTKPPAPQNVGALPPENEAPPANNGGNQLVGNTPPEENNQTSVGGLPPENSDPSGSGDPVGTLPPDGGGDLPPLNPPVQTDPTPIDGASEAASTNAEVPQTPAVDPATQAFIQQQLAISAVFVKAFTFAQPVAKRAIELRQRQMGATLADTGLSNKDMDKLVGVLGNALGSQNLFKGGGNTMWQGAQHWLSRPFAAVGLINQDTMDRLDDRLERRVLDTDKIRSLLGTQEGAVMTALEAQFGTDATAILDVIKGNTNRDHIQTLTDQLGNTDLIPAEMISDVKEFATQHALLPKNKNDVNGISQWIETLERANKERKAARDDTMQKLLDQFKESTYYSGHLNEPGIDPTLGLSTLYEGLYRLPFFTGAREYREGRDAASQAQRMGQDRNAANDAFSKVLDGFLGESQDSRALTKEMKTYDTAIKQVAMLDAALADSSNRTRMSPGLFEPGYIAIRNESGEEKMVRASAVRDLRNRAIETVYGLESTRAQKIADMIDAGNFGEAKDAFQKMMDTPGAETFAAGVLMRIQHADAAHSKGDHQLDRMGEFVDYINKISQSAAPRGQDAPADGAMAGLDAFRATFAKLAFKPIINMGAATIQPEFSNPGLPENAQMSYLNALTSVLTKPLDYAVGVGSYLTTMGGGSLGGRGIALTEGEAASQYKYSLSAQDTLDGVQAYLSEQLGADMGQIEANVAAPLRAQLNQSKATDSLLAWADRDTLDDLLKAVPVQPQASAGDAAGIMRAAMVPFTQSNSEKQTDLRARVEAAKTRVAPRSQSADPEQNVRIAELKAQFAKLAQRQSDGFTPTGLAALDDYFVPGKSDQPTQQGVTALADIRKQLSDPDHAIEAVYKLSRATNALGTMMIQLASVGDQKINQDIISTLAKINAVDGGESITKSVVSVIGQSANKESTGIAAFKDFVETDSQAYVTGTGTAVADVTRGAGDVYRVKTYSQLREAFTPRAADETPAPVAIEDRLAAIDTLSQFSASVRQLSASQINQIFDTDQSIQNYVATMQLAGSYASLSDLANARSNRVQPAQDGQSSATTYTPLFNRVGLAIARTAEANAVAGDRTVDVESILKSATRQQVAQSQLVKTMVNDLREGARQQFVLTRSTDLLSLSPEQRKTAINAMLTQAESVESLQAPTISAVQQLVVEFSKKSPNAAAVLLVDTLRVNPNHANILLDGLRKSVAQKDGITVRAFAQVLDAVDASLSDEPVAEVRTAGLNLTANLRMGMKAPNPGALATAVASSGSNPGYVDTLSQLFTDCKLRLPADREGDRDEINRMESTANAVIANPLEGNVAAFIACCHPNPDHQDGPETALARHALRSVATHVLSTNNTLTQPDGLKLIELQFWREQVDATSDRGVGDAVVDNQGLLDRLSETIADPQLSQDQSSLALVTAIVRGVNARPQGPMAPKMSALGPAVLAVLNRMPVETRFSSPLFEAVLSNPTLEAACFASNEADGYREYQAFKNADAVINASTDGGLNNPLDRLAALVEPKNILIAREFVKNKEKMAALGTACFPFRSDGAVAQNLVRLAALAEDVGITTLQSRLKSGTLPSDVRPEALARALSADHPDAALVVDRLRAQPQLYLDVIKTLASRPSQGLIPLLAADVSVLNSFASNAGQALRPEELYDGFINKVFSDAIDAVDSGLHQNPRALLVLGMCAQVNPVPIAGAIEHHLEGASTSPAKVGDAIARLRSALANIPVSGLSADGIQASHAVVALRGVLGRCDQLLARNIGTTSGEIGKLAARVLTDQQAGRSYQTSLNLLIQVVENLGGTTADTLTEALRDTDGLSPDHDTKRLFILSTVLGSHGLPSVRQSSNKVNAALLGELLNGRAVQFFNQQDVQTRQTENGKKVEAQRCRVIDRMIESSIQIKGSQLTIDAVDRLNKALVGVPNATEKMAQFVKNTDLIGRAGGKPPESIPLETLRYMVDKYPRILATVLADTQPTTGTTPRSVVDFERQLTTALNLPAQIVVNLTQPSDDQVAAVQPDTVPIESDAAIVALDDVSIGFDAAAVQLDKAVIYALLAQPEVDPQIPTHLQFAPLKQGNENQSEWIDSIFSERVLRDRLDVLHVASAGNTLRLLSSEEKATLIADWKASLNADPNWEARVLNSPQLLSSLNNLNLATYLVNHPYLASKHQSIITENSGLNDVLLALAKNKDNLPAIAPVVSYQWFIANQSILIENSESREALANQSILIENLESRKALANHPLLFSGPKQQLQVRMLKNLLKVPHEDERVVNNDPTAPVVVPEYPKNLNLENGLRQYLSNPESVAVDGLLPRTKASTPAHAAGDEVPDVPDLETQTTPDGTPDITPRVAADLLAVAASALEAGDPNSVARNLLRLVPAAAGSFSLAELMQLASQVKDPVLLQTTFTHIDTVRAAIADAAISAFDFSKTVSYRSDIDGYVAEVAPKLDTLSQIWPLISQDRRTEFLEKLNQSIPPEVVPALVQYVGQAAPKDQKENLGDAILKAAMKDPKTGRNSEGRATHIAQMIADRVITAGQDPANKVAAFSMSDRLLVAVDAVFGESTTFSGALSQQIYVQLLHRVGFPTSGDDLPSVPDPGFLNDPTSAVHATQVKWLTNALVHEYRTQASGTIKSTRRGYETRYAFEAQPFNDRMKTFIKRYTSVERRSDEIGIPSGIAEVVFGGVARSTLKGSGGHQVKHAVTFDQDNQSGSSIAYSAARVASFLFGVAGMNDQTDWTTDALKQVVGDARGNDAVSRIGQVLDYTTGGKSKYDALSISMWQRWATPYAGRLIQRVKATDETLQYAVLAAANQRAPEMILPRKFNDALIQLTNRSGKVLLEQAIPSAMRSGVGRNLFTLLGTELFKGPLKAPAQVIASGFSRAYAYIFGPPLVETLGQEAVDTLVDAARQADEDSDRISLSDLMLAATVPSSVLAVNLSSDQVTDPLIEFVQNASNQNAEQNRVQSALLKAAAMARMIFEAGSSHPSSYFEGKLSVLGKSEARLLPGDDQLRLRHAKSGDRILELIGQTMTPSEYLFVAARHNPETGKQLAAASPENLVAAAIRTTQGQTPDFESAAAVELLTLGIRIPRLQQSSQWQIATNLMLNRRPLVNGRPGSQADIDAVCKIVSELGHVPSAGGTLRRALDTYNPGFGASSAEIARAETLSAAIAAAQRALV